jgi:hypothetical protein
MPPTNPFEYQKPTEAQIPTIETTREAYKVLYAYILSLPECRERSLGITKLEESAHWTIKGLVFAK